MKNNLIKLAVVLSIGFISFSSFGQNTDSPYSSYGYGLLRDNVTSTQRQMGGIGYAMSSGRQINVMNPASYSRIDSLTFLFDMGADASFIRRSDGDVKENQAGGGLDYITLQFPISRRIGMSIGILPYSSVGYAFGSEIDNGSTQHSGTGGLNEIYAGISGNLFKGFSVGANISYLFGSITNDIYALTDGSTSVFEQTLSVRDWDIRIGAQYSLPISKKETIGIGAIFSPGKDLLGDAQVVKYAFETSSNTIKPDTVADVRMKNGFSTASTFGVGINYQRGTKLLVEADFTYQPWSKAKFEKLSDFPATRFANRYKVALGGQFRPKERGSYFENVTYRAGVSYNRDYVMAGSNNIGEWTVACGVGLPTLSTKTIINVGLEYKHRQATPNPLVKENYFSLTVGINFNELWFFKRKID
ncbi:MAG: hypothetical protein J1E38_07055 [Paramuribaculum sp.]|nr:hypothetical protein [Paramuribaculum sp.]